jgi:hypothetical protein
MKKFHKMELKSPSIPLFQRGRPQFPSLLETEVGRDYSFFKRLNSYKKDNFKKFQISYCIVVGSERLSKGMVHCLDCSSNPARSVSQRRKAK